MPSDDSIKINIKTYFIPDISPEIIHDFLYRDRLPRQGLSIGNLLSVSNAIWRPKSPYKLPR